MSPEDLLHLKGQLLLYEVEAEALLKSEHESTREAALGMLEILKCIKLLITHLELSNKV